MRIYERRVIELPSGAGPNVKLPVRSFLLTVPVGFIRHPETNAGLGGGDGIHLRTCADANAGGPVEIRHLVVGIAIWHDNIGLSEDRRRISGFPLGDSVTGRP